MFNIKDGPIEIESDYSLGTYDFREDRLYKLVKLNDTKKMGSGESSFIFISKISFMYKLIL